MKRNMETSDSISPRPAALEARHLSLSWDGTHKIVQDVNLRVEVGETVCMVGRSGCGKTTILHALAGLSTPMSGEVFVGGKVATGVPGQISYMFQKDLLLPNKRVLDNVCLPLLVCGASKQEAYKKARPLLGRFGLSGTEEMWPSQLSGGMRQRAAFLRTYLMGAEVMLLDEPFSALDAITRRDLRQWFSNMCTELNIASLMVTHDVDEAVAMAHRIYVLGGSPAGIVGEVEVLPHSEKESGDFELTENFVSTKRKVLDLLN